MSPFKTFFLLAAAASIPAEAFALGFRLVDQDAFATARGEAFVATADNPSAVFYNPAGITQIDQLTARISAYGISFPVEYTAPDGKSYRSKNYNQGYGDFYVAGKVGNTPISLGYGGYSPWGLSVDYPDDTPFRTLSTKASIIFATGNPVVAVQVTRSLSVAAGLTFNVARATFHQGIAEQGDDFKFVGTGSAVGFNLGLMWQPDEHHSFGVRYISATPIRFSGHSRAALNSNQQHQIRDGNQQIEAANEAIKTIKKTYGSLGEAAVNNILASNGLPTEEIPKLQSNFREEDADTKILFPDIITVGYSFRPNKSWNIELDVDYTRWDQLNQVTLHNQYSADAQLPFNYRASLIYSLGVTYYTKYGLHLSGGYIFSEETVPDDSYSPSVPDAQRQIFSVGLGQEIGRYTWDLTYQYSYAPDRAIKNSTLADGVYQFSSHAITLSAGIKF